MKYLRKGFSLVEIIIATTIMGLVILGVVGFTAFFLSRVNRTLERYNMYSQISYALEDMKLRFPSAIEFTDYFASPAINDTVAGICPNQPGCATQDSLEFNAESDIYDITPDDASDNVWYEYYVISDPTDLQDGALALATNSRSGSPEVEILVDSRYQPTLTFFYTHGDEPNFISVQIETQSSKEPDISFSFIEGIKLWFVDAIQ